MPKSFERCVSKVKAKGEVRNAYAVCTNAYKKSHGGKAPKLHHPGSRRHSGRGR